LKSVEMRVVDWDNKMRVGDLELQSVELRGFRMRLSLRGAQI
jgi:hypothetical protein